jgi:porphobilinogen synthase
MTKTIPLFVLVFAMFFRPVMAAAPPDHAGLVRIAILKDADEVVLKIPGAYEISDPATGEILGRGRRLPRVVIQKGAQGVRLGARELPLTRLRFSAQRDVTVVAGRKERRYRGLIDVNLDGNQKFFVVNRLDVEDYIRGGGRMGLFFGIPRHKDPLGTQAYADLGIVPRLVRAVKKHFPDFLVVTDVCLCAYTDHGHCGVVKHQDVDNDQTLPLLGKMAVAHAHAGADMVAPSDMMDFRVRQIRSDLDRAGCQKTLILSYAVKYASAFYGPFREAADSAPGFGDRKSYQMDPANAREALKEARQDIEEGADMIMVKPALAYLDIIRSLRDQTLVPIAAYSVSGEYAMIKAAAQNGWISEKDLVLETVTSMKRAGSDLIITYHAADILHWLKECS